MPFVWGAVCRPKQGQAVSGDVFVVVPFGEQQVLAAVIDGLGGGEEAAKAARAAAEVLQRNPDHDLAQLLHQAHKALHGTRGAVIGALSLDARQRRATFIGIGNIGVVVFSDHVIKPISKNGILGYRMPQLLPLSYAYNSGDTFVLFSDGVTSRFTIEANAQPPSDLQAYTEQVLQEHGKFTDDATVLAIADRP